MHVSPSRLEREARFGKRGLPTRSAGRRRECNARLPPPLLAVKNGWARPGPRPRAHSHCLLAARTNDGLNPALGYFERSKRVSISNSFWASGQETATNGFLNECKRVLGFAGLRLGCLRTELGGPAWSSAAARRNRACSRALDASRSLRSASLIVSCCSRSMVSIRFSASSSLSSAFLQSEWARASVSRARFSKPLKSSAAWFTRSITSTPELRSKRFPPADSSSPQHGGLNPLRGP